MMLRSLQKARDKGYQEGIKAAQEWSPPAVYVAGGDRRIRHRLIGKISPPEGRGKPPAIERREGLMGLRSGVLVCGHATPRELEVEARQRGMTLIYIDQG